MTKANALYNKPSCTAEFSVCLLAFLTGKYATTNYPAFHGRSKQEALHVPMYVVQQLDSGPYAQAAA